MTGKQDISIAEDYNVRGRTFVRQQKFDEAIAEYGKAETADPLYIDTYLNLTEAYILQEKHEQAKEMLDKALLIEKDNGEVYFHLGNVTYFLRDPKQARVHFMRAIELGFDEARVSFHLAALYTDMQDYANALHYYGRVVELVPTNGAARIRRLEILVAEGRHEEAMKEVDELIAVRPDTFEGYHYKFIVLLSLGREEEAKMVLDGAMTRFPEDLGFVYDKIKYYEQLKDFQAALDLIEERFSPDKPGWDDICKEKVKLLFALKRMEDAKPLVEEVLAKGFDAEMYYYAMSMYYGYGAYPRALALAQEQTSHFVDDGVFNGYYYSSLYYEALCTKMLGDKAKARELFAETSKTLRWACSRYPEHLALYLYRGMCYRELKDFERAFEMVDFIISVSDEGIAEAFLLRSKLYEETNQPKKAEADKKRAVGMSPMLQEMGL